MNTETMTIHEALANIKMIDKRIQEAIKSHDFVYTKKANAKKIYGKNVSDIEEETKTSYQSICDLLKRRAAIKRGVVLSNAGVQNDNAVRDIEIDGEQYTIAEVIDLQNVIAPLVGLLLQKLTLQKRSADNILLYNTENLQHDAEEFAINIVGKKDSNIDADTLAKYKDSFIKDNTIELVDPLDVTKKIEKISRWYDEFTAKADSKISVHNAVTTIEISY